MRHFLPKLTIFEFFQAYGPLEFVWFVLVRQFLDVMPVVKQFRIDTHRLYEAQCGIEERIASKTDRGTMLNVLARAAARQTKTNSIRYSVAMTLEVERAQKRWFWRAVKMVGFLMALLFGLTVMRDLGLGWLLLSGF